MLSYGLRFVSWNESAERFMVAFTDEVQALFFEPKTGLWYEGKYSDDPVDFS